MRTDELYRAQHLIYSAVSMLRDLDLSRRAQITIHIAEPDQDRRAAFDSVSGRVEQNIRVTVGRI